MDHSRDRSVSLGLGRKGGRGYPSDFMVNYRLQCPAECRAPLERHLANWNGRQDPSERAKRGLSAAGTGGLSRGQPGERQEPAGEWGSLLQQQKTTGGM